MLSAWRWWLALVVVLAAGAAWADGVLLGRRIKVSGRWTGTTFEVFRVQFRDDRKDPGRVRVAGRIDAVDHAGLLRVGPVVVERQADTRLDGLDAGDLAAGRTIEVDGIQLGPGRVRAQTITRAAAQGDQVELLGQVTDETEEAGDWLGVVLLGVPVQIPDTVSIREVELTRRLDERRPAEQFTVQLFGRPLVIGGQIESNTRWFGNPELEPSNDDDEIKQEFELKPELFYRVSRNAVVFLQGKALYESKFESGEDEHVKALERGETWLYLGDVRRGHLSAQVGRQNFREPREWWWDQDLDAVRAYYDRGRYHLETAVAYEVAAVSTDPGHIEASEKGVLRVLGNAAWSWRDKQRLDGFFVYQHDTSGRLAPGSIIADDEEDETDATVAWVGGRASGRVDDDAWGALDYAFDVAGVVGRERLVEFDDATPGHSRVGDTTNARVRGFAIDTHATWLLPVPPRLALTLGYAFGSRDFQQTGLERNKDRFRGVDRFAYYGTLLRPELANLHVGTLAVGRRFLTASSIELLYHVYRQAEAADALRDADLDTDPNGQDAFLGQEWDAVLGMREWEHVDLELIGSVFRAGPAYGERAGRLASGVFLKMRYSF